MNEQLKLKANMAAAKMLGLSYITHAEISSLSIELTGNRRREELFNIFTNPADCLDVIRRLGDEHGTWLQPDRDGSGWGWTGHKASRYKPFGVAGFDTYEEALAAAVMKVTT